MAKGGRGGRRGGGGGAAAGIGQTMGAVRTAMAPAAPGTNVPINATILTNADAQNLRDQQDSMYDANTTAAVKMYISNTDFDGHQHSMSQTMNYLLDNGVDLATADVNAINRRFGLHLTANDLASMAYTDAYMAVAMHNIGRDVTLSRGAHDDLLRNVFGISDYTKMTDAQLQAALVGQAFQTTSYMSTSYDYSKNPFLSAASGSGVSGGREVVYTIKAGANTGMLFGAKSQTEIILNKGTNFRITGVRRTGNTATPKNSRSKPQIEIQIETF